MNRFDLTSPSYEKNLAPIHSMNLMLQLKLCCFIAIASLQIRNIKADLCFLFFFKITVVLLLSLNLAAGVILNY